MYTCLQAVKKKKHFDSNFFTFLNTDMITLLFKSPVSAETEAGHRGAQESITLLLQIKSYAPLPFTL